MKSVNARVTSGLQVGSKLKCVDNSGATEVEIIAVKGGIRKVYKLEEELKVAKGVKHAALSKSTLAKDI